MTQAFFVLGVHGGKDYSGHRYSQRVRWLIDINIAVLRSVTIARYSLQSQFYYSL